MIYYVGAYRTENIAERDPQGSIAEDVKMAYIISAIKSLGCKLTVVSVVSSFKRGFHRRKTCEIDALETQVFLESYDDNCKILSGFGVLYRLFALFLYLMRHAGKNDRVIVYNTQLYSVPIRFAKQIKKFNMILEVEELFYMDDRNPKDVRRKNIEVRLLKAADQYIAASQLLREKISGNKACIVLYGGYEIPPVYKTRSEDGIIHVVYAGGIDTLRRVDLAVESFSYLPDNYRLHILGYGTNEALDGIKKKITKINQKAGFNKVTYEGCLHGAEYSKFLQECHIGLNLQAIGSSIEDAAFPSKISSYMSHGLIIVSSRLVSIENSPFSKHVTFYEENTPQAIASAILSARKNSPEQQIQFIKTISREFMDELQNMLCPKEGNCQ